MNTDFARICSDHFSESDFKAHYFAEKKKSGSSPRKCRILQDRNDERLCIATSIESASYEVDID